MVKCKRENCNELTHVIRGRYAYLCDAHRKEFGEGVKKKSLPAPSLTSNVKRLIEISERIDNASLQYRETRAQLMRDLNHFNAVMDDIKKVAKLLISNDNAN